MKRFYRCGLFVWLQVLAVSSFGLCVVSLVFPITLQAGSEAPSGPVAAFSVPAEQGAYMPGQTPQAPEGPSRVVGAPTGNPSAVLPPLPKALPYHRSGLGGTPPERQEPTALPTNQSRSRVQAPIVPDQDGNVLANVPGPATRETWRGYPDPARQTGPAGSGDPIGEFILDSFGSPQAPKAPDANQQQSPTPGSETPSLVEQVGSGIGKMFRGIVTGR